MLLDAYHVTDRADLDDNDPFTEYLPTLLLLTQAPPPDLADRLAAVAAQGAPVGISVVVLGRWTPGATLEIQADGHLHDPDHPPRVEHEQADHGDGDPYPMLGLGAGACGRVAVLDTDAAMDALGVVREAHTGIPAPTDRSSPGTRSGRDRFTATMNGIAPPQPPPADIAATPAPEEPTPGQETGPGQGTPEPAAHPETDSRVRVQVRVLGAPVIWDRAGAPVPRMRSGATELLVLLAVRRSGMALNDVKEHLWPTATMKQADKRLSTEVAQLRGAIRQVAGDRSIEPVINKDSRYHLDPDLVQVDLWEFTDTVQQATAPATGVDPTGERARRIALLRRALDMTRGQVLAEGKDYEWIDTAREHLRRLLHRAHLHLVDLLTQTGEHPQAAQVAMAAVDLDPANEEVARTAMRALAAAGRHSEIPALVRRLKTALDELDLEPAPETTALAQQLRPGRRPENT